MIVHDILCPEEVKLDTIVFSKPLEQFYSMLLTYTVTIVEALWIPRFTFWNGCYMFVPSSIPFSERKSRYGQTVTKNYSNSR